MLPPSAEVVAKITLSNGKGCRASWVLQTILPGMVPDTRVTTRVTDTRVTRHQGHQGTQTPGYLDSTEHSGLPTSFGYPLPGGARKFDLLYQGFLVTIEAIGTSAVAPNFGFFFKEPR